MTKRATATLHAVLGVWLLHATAAAAIDCSNPDNLCTGDPCVIPALLIDSPCTADFGTRTVVIAGALDVQTTTLELHAGAISVEAPLVARTTDVSLYAGSDIEVETRFDTSPPTASELPGAIVLDAGGTVRITGSLRASNLSKSVGFGSESMMTITAGNAIEVTGSLDVSGGGAAGTINLTAGGDITLDGPVGAVAAWGGHVNADASGSLTVRGGINASGGGSYLSHPGRIVLRGATGVAVESKLTATSSHRYGYDDPPMVDIASSAGDVIVSQGINANTHGPTEVLIDAAGLVRLDAAIRARSRSSCLVRLTGATVQVTDEGRITATGSRVEFIANAGDLTLSGRVSPGPGRTVQGTASGNLLADGVFRTRPDGCIGLSAGGTLDTSGGRFDAPIVPTCP